MPCSANAVGFLLLEFGSLHQTTGIADIAVGLLLMALHKTENLFFIAITFRVLKLWSSFSNVDFASGFDFFFQLRQVN
jgi:hypothetical protein